MTSLLRDGILACVCFSIRFPPGYGFCSEGRPVSAAKYSKVDRDAGCRGGMYAACHGHEASMVAGKFLICANLLATAKPALAPPDPNPLAAVYIL